MVEGNAPLTCADGARQEPAWLGPSESWPPTWPRAIARARPRTSTTPSGSPIPSMSSASPTAASTRCAGACRTRRSGTGAARPTRSIGSASSCSTGYERLDERGHDRMLLGLRHGDPHDELLGPGWPKSRSVTST